MTPPVTVLLVTPSLNVGGNERQILRLVQSLDRDLVRPIVCCLVTGGPFVDEVRRIGVPVHVVQRRGRFDLAQLRTIRRIARAEKVQVIHSFRFSANFWGRLAGLLSGVPVLIASERNVFLGKSWIRRMLDRALLPATSAIAVNAEAVRDYLVQHENLPAKKIHVIYNGIDAATFADAANITPTDRTRLRGEFGLAPDRPVVLQLCRIDPQKAIEVFLEAIPAIRLVVPDAQFLLVGAAKLPEEKQYERDLLRQVEALGLTNTLVCAGERPAEDALAVADVLVQTSEREGCPNVVLEAMAAARPVVATDAGGTRECVVEGVTGFVVPRGDAAAVADRISRLLRDPELRASMGKRGRERVVSFFSVDKLGQDTATMYLDAVGLARDLGKMS